MGHPGLTAATAREAVRFTDVTLGYRREPVISGIDGVFTQGSMTAVIGANGCGKSTLLKAIAGLVSPSTGELSCRFRNADIGYLPQAGEIDRAFPITVADFVSMGLWRQTGAFGAMTGERAAKVRLALDAVGMLSHAGHLIGELSGGQFQRMRFARLLLQDAKLLLLDEPFTGIDARAGVDLMRLLHHWHAAGATLVVVLHDLELVRREFPLALALGEGRMLAWGAASLGLAALRVPVPMGQESRPS